MFVKNKNAIQLKNLYLGFKNAAVFWLLKYFVKLLTTVNRYLILYLACICLEIIVNELKLSIINVLSMSMH